MLIIENTGSSDRRLGRSQLGLASTIAKTVPSSDFKGKKIEKALSKFAVL